MTNRFDLEYSMSKLNPVLIERLRARIARRPGRWRRRMRRQRNDRAEVVQAWEPRRAA